MPKSKRIPEGFRGQRLVVLPAGVREQVRTHPLMKGLLVTDAGIFPQAKSHFIERSHGTPTTLLIICLAGRGWFRLADGPRQSVLPGSVVWLPATPAPCLRGGQKRLLDHRMGPFSGRRGRVLAGINRYLIGGRDVRINASGGRRVANWTGLGSPRPRLRPGEPGCSGRGSPNGIGGTGAETISK